MFLYLLKRILLILPTLFAIMVVSFIVSKNVPGDPVLAEMDQAEQGKSAPISRERNRREYRRISHEKGLDKPLFYFSLTSVAFPDTLHRILKLGEREALDELTGTYGNWEEISAWYHAVCDLEERTFRVKSPDSIKNEIDDIKFTLGQLRSTADAADVNYLLTYLDTTAARYAAVLPGLRTELAAVRGRWRDVVGKATPWKLYVPTIHWHGFRNQFQRWIGNVFRLDFGRSYVDRRKVSDKIRDALPWSFFMGLFSFFIAYLIAVPVGVYSVRHRNSWQDRTMTMGLFLLYSVPSFVMAMMLMLFLCNPEYLYLFPTSGVASDGSESWPFFSRIADHAYHLFLPTVAYSYSGIAFLSRQMRAGMLETINMDFIRTARAKGLPERTVVWKHAMRNSVIPLVTHIANLLPRLVSGSIVIETIFAIPGLGRMTIQATFQYDHPVIIAMFTIGGLLTMLGILASDLLYAFVDPRISYSKN